MDAGRLVFEVYETEPPKDPDDCPKRIIILAATCHITVAWRAYEELCRQLPHRPLVLVDCGRTIAESWKRRAYEEPS
jgi:hypothetical protein